MEAICGRVAGLVKALVLAIIGGSPGYRIEVIAGKVLQKANRFPRSALRPFAGFHQRFRRPVVNFETSERKDLARAVTTELGLGQAAAGSIDTAATATAHRVKGSTHHFKCCMDREQR